MILREVLTNNLALGYCAKVKKLNEAAKELARLSVATRRRKWGAEGFRKRMQAWGKLGGRPRGKKGNRNAN
jgi:hypothetical protein